MTDVDAPVNVKDSAGNNRYILSENTMKMIDKTGNDRIIMGDVSAPFHGLASQGLRLLRANAQSIFLDSANGHIHLGGIGSNDQAGVDGEILLRNTFGIETIRLIGSGYGEIRVSDNANRETFKFDSYSGGLYIGCEDHGGDIIIRNDMGLEVFRLKSYNATLMIGYEAKEGEDGYPGQIMIRDGKGKEAITLSGSSAYLKIGAVDNEGDIEVLDDRGRKVFDVNGDKASLAIGAGDKAGSIRIRDQPGNNSIRIEGSRGNIWLGSQGTNGDLMLFASDPSGTTDYNDADQATIHLDAKAAKVECNDVICNNADCAEEFDVSESEVSEQIESGTVVRIDDNGKLKMSDCAYDTRVAGVISGAGDCKPGITLGRKKSQNLRVPLAMVGKVFCKVEADKFSVKVGDLLTTSNVPGYAMKAADIPKAIGAIIGKALSPLKSGRGLIPILIGSK